MYPSIRILLIHISTILMYYYITVNTESVVNDWISSVIFLVGSWFPVNYMEWNVIVHKL